MRPAAPAADWSRWLDEDRERIARLDLGAELRRTWLVRLSQEWGRLNRDYGLQLRRPLFELHDRGRRWGSWDPERRVIGVSERQIACYTWASVTDTLRHEVAHQYVDERLSGRDDGPHGSQFAAVCRRLGISARASGSGGESLERPRMPSDHDDVRLRRIQKLLALAEDRANENEARVALATAQRLLLEYNVEAADLGGRSDFVERLLQPTMRRFPAFRSRLCLILGDYFFVHVLSVPVYDALADEYAKGVQITGTPFNVDMAEYAWDFLHDQGERLWRVWRKAMGPQRPYARHQFLDGMMRGFAEHLEGEQPQTEVGEALVWKGDAALDDWVRRRSPRIRMRSWRSARQTDARAAGEEEGRKLRLRRPIDDAPRQRGRTLTDGRQ